MSKKSSECVQVVVRCRPMNAAERERNCVKIVHVNKKDREIVLVKPENQANSNDPHAVDRAFQYDAVYDDDATQTEVYEETAFPLVESVIEGYNGTIFACLFVLPAFLFLRFCNFSFAL